jgi:hypothetical protein
MQNLIALYAMKCVAYKPIGTIRKRHKGEQIVEPINLINVGLGLDECNTCEKRFRCTIAGMEFRAGLKELHHERESKVE